LGGKRGGTWAVEDEGSHENIILSHIRVTYKTGSGLEDFIYLTPYIFTQLGATGNNSAIAVLHTFQFTVTHALELFCLH
jgi:hypothetical protein